MLAKQINISFSHNKDGKLHQLHQLYGVKLWESSISTVHRMKKRKCIRELNIIIQTFKQHISTIKPFKIRTAQLKILALQRVFKSNRARIGCLP